MDQELGAVLSGKMKGWASEVRTELVSHHPKFTEARS